MINQWDRIAKDYTHHLHLEDGGHFFIAPSRQPNRVRVLVTDEIHAKILVGSIPVLTLDEIDQLINHLAAVRNQVVQQMPSRFTLEVPT